MQIGRNWKKVDRGGKIEGSRLLQSTIVYHWEEQRQERNWWKIKKDFLFPILEIHRSESTVEKSWVHRYLCRYLGQHVTCSLSFIRERNEEVSWKISDAMPYVVWSKFVYGISLQDLMSNFKLSCEVPKYIPSPLHQVFQH